MHQDIENIIKKFDDIYLDKNSVSGLNQKDFKSFPDIVKHIRTNFIPLIADEVLKVVVENERQRIGQEMDLIWRDTHHDLNLFEQAICELQEDLLFNSSTLEGEQSEHLSLNKENKNNEK